MSDKPGLLKLAVPIKEAFMQYIALGLCPIPIGQEKMPLVPWKEFQDRFPSEAEVCKWIAKYPSLNVGIITGSISNLLVVDIDSDKGREKADQYLPDSLLTPTVKTKKGTHLYFRPPKGQKISSLTRFIPDCDIKCEGGYVVAPPSTNYSWVVDLSTPIADLPANIKSFFFNKLRHNNASIPTVVNAPSDLDLSSGHRDDSLYHIAAILKRGGASEGEANKVILALADKCIPPFAHQDALIKVKSAFTGLPSERSIIRDIEAWVTTTIGDFTYQQCDAELKIQEKNEKAYRRRVFQILLSKNIVERIGTKEGVFRRVIKDESIIDWQGADETRTLDVRLPFDIQDYAHLYKGNMVVIAGAPNAGKSAFLLNVARLNKDKHKIFYFSSEMGAEELKLRIKKFGMDLREWTSVTFMDRASNFADIIQPDAINIIDFYEIASDIYKIGEDLKKIHDKSKSSLTFIAIQKKFNQDLGRGAEFSLEKPRLYLSIEKGELKIIKAKNWADPNDNPNGKTFKFNLINGCDFLEKADTYVYRNT